MNLGASGMRGVAVYYRNTINVNEVEIYIDGFIDHAWVEIPTERGEAIICGCVYRSQSNDSTRHGFIQSTKKVRELITTAYRRNPNLLIAGDFNFKDIDWSND